MTSVAVAPIVEGHGEVSAVRTLLTRVAQEFAPGCFVDVLQPIRVSKSKIVSDPKELLRAIDLAALKLLASDSDKGCVLLLLDADKDAACKLGPQILKTAVANRGHIAFSCVIAVVEFETWLVGGAEELSQLLVGGFEANIPIDPEGQRVGKGWIEEFFDGTKYSESVDQVRLTARFDVRRARSRCSSFDKLCRELLTWCA